MVWGMGKLTGFLLQYDIVVSTDGTNVYAVSSTSSQIFWWDRNPVTGALINEQSISNSDCIFATSVSSSLIISFDQANIYTASGNILCAWAQNTAQLSKRPIEFQQLYKDQYTGSTAEL